MRAVFMGTPPFAVPALAALIASSHEVVAVYSQPPRPAGRGMKLTPSPVQQLAEHHRIPVLTPEHLKSAGVQTQFADHRADIAVVAAYGLLLPPTVLAAPRFGCINIHPSDLPRWRGAAPIQRTIMAGDTATACCIMQMEEGLDTGPVLARRAFAIPDTATAGDLHDAMARLGAELLVETLGALERGTVKPMPQPASDATYAAKITKEDQIIDWSQPAQTINNQIRGLNPAPGALVKLAGDPLKVFAASVERGDVSKPPGTLLDNQLLINAGNGSALRVLELQKAGKTRQKALEFLQGARIPAGILAESLMHRG